MFTHTDDQKWRDYSKMNTFLCKSVFPSMSYEFSGEFADRVDSGRAYLYDRVVFTDRAAALRGAQFAVTWRTAAEAFTLEGSPYWWSPVRRNLLEFVGGTSEAVLSPHDLERPVITYVSRQDWGRRMLIKEDHEVLVKELERLRDEHGYEVSLAKGTAVYLLLGLIRGFRFVRSTSSLWTSCPETNRSGWLLGRR